MIYLNDSYVKEFHAPIVAVGKKKLSLQIVVFTLKVEDSLEIKASWKSMAKKSM